MARRILFVEDEYHFRYRFFGERLEERGYEVVVATNASDALEKFEALDFAVIVVDIMIPPGDNKAFEGHDLAGIVLLQILRPRLAEKPNPPGIIVLTAYPSVLRDVELNMSFVEMEKPVLPGDFLVEVERLTTGRND